MQKLMVVVVVVVVPAVVPAQRSWYIGLESSLSWVLLYHTPTDSTMSQGPCRIQ